jgi:hypothetical protein
MNRSDLELGDVVFYADGTPDAPSVARTTVAGLGHRVHVKAPTAANPVAWAEVDPALLYPTRGEAWAGVIDAADRAVALAMRRMELAQQAAAEAPADPEKKATDT